jgi:serine/threonine protein phosphatase PrpC
VHNLKVLAGMRKAHEAIIQFARPEAARQSRHDLRGGVTSGWTVYWAHAGDSRAYFCATTKVKSVTHDHSVVQQWADLGFISEEQ